jgi:hypothetical protein
MGGALKMLLRSASASSKNNCSHKTPPSPEALAEMRGLSGFQEQITVKILSYLRGAAGWLESISPPSDEVACYRHRPSFCSPYGGRGMCKYSSSFRLWSKVRA